MEKIKTLELFGGIGAPRSALENLKKYVKRERRNKTIWK